jgi:hypothetical protein
MRWFLIQLASLLTNHLANHPDALLRSQVCSQPLDPPRNQAASRLDSHPDAHLHNLAVNHLNNQFASLQVILQGSHHQSQPNNILLNHLVNLLPVHQGNQLLCLLVIQVVSHPHNL